MKFKKKSEARSEIPTTSLPDIIFMLLIFFMVTTVLKQFTGLPVELPDAEKIVKIEGKRHTSYLWIARDGEWSYNDIKISEPRQLYNYAYNNVVADPQLLVSLKFDRLVPMGEITRAQNELRKANALRVNFATGLKQR